MNFGFNSPDHIKNYFSALKEGIPAEKPLSSHNCIKDEVRHLNMPQNTNKLLKLLSSIH